MNSEHEGEGMHPKNTLHTMSEYKFKCLHPYQHSTDIAACVPLHPSVCLTCSPSLGKLRVSIRLVTV